MTDGPTFETLREEFQTVVARHNELMQRMPAYTVAQLYQLADHHRLKHGIEINDIQDEGDGVYVIVMDGGEQAAALGVADDPAKVADLDVVMFDDREAERLLRGE